MICQNLASSFIDILKLKFKMMAFNGTFLQSPFPWLLLAVVLSRTDNCCIIKISQVAN